MSDKKQTNIKQKPEHEISCGTVIASIYLRQSNCGFPYYDFSLSRTWKSMTTGKPAHGTSFFDKNETDLIQAIRKACTWVRDKNAEAAAGEALVVEKQHAS